MSASATASGDTQPCSSQGTTVTSHPSRASRFIGSRTALCSEAAVTRCLPRRLCGLRNSFDRQVVRFGRAGREDDLAGARPEGGGDLLAGAVDGLAASQPNRCEVLAAFPYCSVKYGSIASSTRGSVRVVAWLSR